MKRARTVQRLKLLREIGRIERRRRVPRQRYPFVIEVEYAKRLVAIVDQMRRAADGLMSALPSLTHTVSARRTDAHEGDRVHFIIEEIRGRFASREQLKLVVAAFAHRVAAHQRAEFARQVKAALGVDLALLGADVRMSAARLADFVAENVSLIRARTMIDPLNEIELVVTRGFAAGARNEVLAKEIEQRFEVARSRARVIARDQIGKLNAQLGRDANKEIGIDQWRWRSMRDKAVRPEHRTLDRQSEHAPFSYSGESGKRPPILPGEEVQCRCYDEAVFGQLLAELER